MTKSGIEMEDSPVAVPKPAVAPHAPAAAGHKGHAGHGGQPVMSEEMAQQMGHGGNMDLPAMVRDMRDRKSVV